VDDFPDSQQSLNLSAEEELLLLKPPKKPQVPITHSLSPELRALDAFMASSFKSRSKSKSSVSTLINMPAPKTPTHDSGITTPTTAGTDDGVFEDSFPADDDSFLVRLTQQTEAQFQCKRTPRRSVNSNVTVNAITPVIESDKVNEMGSVDIFLPEGPCFSSTPAAVASGKSQLLVDSTPTSNRKKLNDYGGRKIRNVRSDPNLKAVTRKSLRYEPEDEVCPPTQVCVGKIMGDFEEDDNDYLFSQLEIPEILPESK